MLKVNMFLIVHDAESIEKHPDLIGFAVKTDLNGTPLRDTNGRWVPDNTAADEIRAGDKIVYYTRFDHLIRGIFEVVEKLREDDHRRAKEWKRGLIQFAIKPILQPKTATDFRNIIFSGKEPLNMFSHLDNLKRQWGMSIGGKNYIKNLDPHDFGIIEKALEHAKKPSTDEEELGVPKFDRRHLATQFRIVKILRSYGLKPHVARNDKAKIAEKGGDVLDSIPEFHNERICDIASRINCIGFTDHQVPQILIEVVDTPSTLTESLYRLNEVALSYPRSEEQKFYIVGPETSRGDFDEKVGGLTFRSLRDANCLFLSYPEIGEIFKESQKEKATL